jgi:hypothetical protein
LGYFVFKGDLFAVKGGPNPGPRQALLPAAGNVAVHVAISSDRVITIQNRNFLCELVWDKFYIKIDDFMEIYNLYPNYFDA